MDIFIKCIAAVLLVLILHLVLSKGGKDFSVLLSVAACCIILIFVVSSIESVFDFVSQLQNLAQLDFDILGVVLKSVGIGILTEIVCAFCADSGNSALGKTLHIVAAFVIIFISIPLFEALIGLVEEILITV